MIDSLPLSTVRAASEVEARLKRAAELPSAKRMLDGRRAGRSRREDWLFERGSSRWADLLRRDRFD